MSRSVAGMRKLGLPVHRVGPCSVLLLSEVCMAPSASAIALIGEDGATGMAAWRDVLMLGAIIAGVMTWGLNGQTPVFANALRIGEGLDVRLAINCKEVSFGDHPTRLACVLVALIRPCLLQD